MKNNSILVPSLVALSFSFSLTACGVKGAIDGVQTMNTSTSQMNAKMDTTNQSMTVTNSKMDKTNVTMSGMSVKMDTTNSVMGGMSVKMETTNSVMSGMSGKMDETNGKMEKMVKAIHNQTLDVALTDILKPENTKYVNGMIPNPASMMVPGKIFAEEATADELVQFTYITLLEINSAQPDESLKIKPAAAAKVDDKVKADAAGVAGTPAKAKVEDQDAPESDFSQETKDTVDSNKNIKLYMLQVVAGLTPQATVERMIQEQITSNGRYEASAYNFLALRHRFITDFMLEASLLEGRLNNPGMFEEALKYMGYLKFIEKLPFAKQIKVEVMGMFNFARNKTIDISKANVQKYYAKLKTRLNQLRPEFVDSKDGTIANRMALIKTQIDAGVAGQ